MSSPKFFVCRTTHAVVDPLSRVTSVGVVPARCSPVPVTLTCTPVMLEDGALSAVMVNPTLVPSVTDAALAVIVRFGARASPSVTVTLADDGLPTS